MVCHIHSFLVGVNHLVIVVTKWEFTHIVAWLGASWFDEFDVGADVLLFLDGQGGSPGGLGSLLALFTSSAGRTFIGNIMHLVCAPSADFDKLLFGHCGNLIVSWSVKSDEVGMGGEKAGPGGGG